MGVSRLKAPNMGPKPAYPKFCEQKCFTIQLDPNMSFWPTLGVIHSGKGLVDISQPPKVCPLGFHSSPRSVSLKRTLFLHPKWCPPSVHTEKKGLRLAARIHGCRTRMLVGSMSSALLVIQFTRIVVSGCLWLVISWQY